ncbi:MAG: RNA polymerase factor sigma-54 [bacterium]|jgi:RNA polymerase sigma-54 factor
MSVAYSLILEQTQKLIMTQELRQAIAVLQMPIQELLAFIQEELQENPLLDLEEEDFVPETAEDLPEWLEYFSDGSDLGFVPDYSKRQPAWDSFLSRENTLAEHLQTEWDMVARTPEEKRIGSFIIGSLDPNGYLRCTVSELAAMLQQPRSRVVRILKAIQRIDLSGAGARNLEECLIIQAQALGCLTPEIRQVIMYHLSDLADGRLGKVAEELGLSLPEVQAIRDFIRTLDPKPGREYNDGEKIHYVIPDVTVKKVAGEYVILVNDTVGNRLRVNNSYRHILTDGSSVDSATKKYVKTKLNSAVWLIRSIEQRRLTIYRIVETLLRLQGSFFDFGVRHLRPLTLREVADKIDVHESTVSRATANKFIQTPHGVFPLRILFDSGVDSSDGKGAAAESVKRIITDLVLQEDPYNPLSDQKLSKILAQRGINVSRRTVAKYRQEANIPSSSSRRRY